MIKIRAIGYIAEAIGGREFEIQSEKPVKIRELISLPQNFESRVIVLVNGKPATLDALVKSGDKVTLMPTISGG
ncbi:MAG: MoaD/ThiS family protein [archaeon GB-1867-005]|nr:MoaD/ThiS family protein [Candidatus Culexmicrobium cathedralense]